MLYLIYLLLEGLGWVSWGLDKPHNSTPRAQPCLTAPAREFGETIRRVEGGQLRIWSRRRLKRGDVVRLVEYRSDPAPMTPCHVTANDGSFEGFVPDPTSQGILARLDHIHEGMLRVESDGMVLRVRACGEPRGQEEDRFVAECVALLAALRQSSVPGRLHLGAGLCPVCREAASPSTACARCATPHHRPCWVYAGKCSVYGCGGTVLRE